MISAPGKQTRAEAFYANGVNYEFHEEPDAEDREETERCRAMLVDYIDSYRKLAPEDTSLAAYPKGDKYDGEEIYRGRNECSFCGNPRDHIIIISPDGEYVDYEHPMARVGPLRKGFGTVDTLDKKTNVRISNVITELHEQGKASTAGLDRDAIYALRRMMVRDGCKLSVTDDVIEVTEGICPPVRPLAERISEISR